MLFNFVDKNFPFCVVVSENKRNNFTNYLFGKTKDVAYFIVRGHYDDSQFFHFDSEEEMNKFVMERQLNSNENEDVFFKDATHYMQMKKNNMLICREINEEERQQLIKDILERNTSPKNKPYG